MVEYVGRIIRHIYKSEDQEFAISRFRTAPSDGKPQEEFIVKGPLKKYADRHEISLTGQWETHPKYGTQFAVSTACLNVPKDKRAIREHLKIVVQGVGEKTRNKIVDYFGEDTLEVIRQTPERLNEITGISKNIQKKIVAGVLKEKIVREVDLKLGDYQFPVNTANRIYEKYGEDAQAVLDQSPYALIGVEGVGFKSADRFAQQSGTFRPDWIARVEAYAHSLLKEEAKNGHSCLPIPVVLQKTMEGCQVERTLAESALQNLFRNRTIIYDRVESPAGPLEMAFLPWCYYAETKATEHFNRVLYGTVEKPAPREAVLHILGELEQLAQKQLTSEQRLAVERAFTEKISVITGKPGTGKTTTTRAIVAVADRLGLKYGLCAPTGRAAKNMTNACGKKAVTIHRLLEYKRAPGDEEMFKRTEDNQLGFDLLLVDEASMLSGALFRNLVAAVPNGCRVVFIGDDNQLPSVDAGRVLYDIIRSQVCAVTQLNIIHRQAQQSHIIANAHRILDGKQLYLPVTDTGRINFSDCLFLEAPMVENPDTEKQVEDANWVRETIRLLCSRDLPECGFGPKQDIQVLTPRKDGPCGVHALNQELQSQLNGSSKILYSDRFRTFRESDRVMVIKNNYDLNIFNGDIGTVIGYDFGEEVLVFEFYGEIIKMKPADLEHVVLSYACTVHKAQGSEYKAVVLLVLKQHGIMLQRNLLYTGVTRAKQKLVLVGSKPALGISIRNVKPVQRNTLLWHRLSRLRVHAQLQPVA